MGMDQEGVLIPMEKVKAEAGMMIGVSGIENLVCPKCSEALEWVEYQEDGSVKMNAEGHLVPAYEEKIDIGRASTKEAFCCDVVYKATPLASFLISAQEDQV
jgi:hypothetical protein